MPEVIINTSPLQSRCIMIKELTLYHFKNFREATLRLGPFTVLVGTNASGKSNLRDAFRFIHGISRGYMLTEIIGQKYIEGGALQWRGIRGGTREVAFRGTHTFGLEVTLDVQIRDNVNEASYRIEVDIRRANGEKTSPQIYISREHLKVKGYSSDIFNSHPGGNAKGRDQSHIYVQVRQVAQGRDPTYVFLNDRPVFTQFIEDRRVQPSIRDIGRAAQKILSDMRFLDLSAEAMREPSLPGQTILGDRGENLSSVLQAISQNKQSKAALTEWVRALTPMDAIDFEFPEDLTGKILVSLVEANDQRISAHSASDGTLRFLTILAALLGPKPARFYFFEELENGIHPTRVDLLLQLIEQNVTANKIQVVSTTHSPQLLRLLSKDALQHASLIYRLEGQAEAHINRIVDLPEARPILAHKDLARLFESGWMETTVEFADEQEIHV